MLTAPHSCHREIHPWPSSALLLCHDTGATSTPGTEELRKVGPHHWDRPRPPAPDGAHGQLGGLLTVQPAHRAEWELSTSPLPSGWEPSRTLAPRGTVLQFGKALCGCHPPGPGTEQQENSWEVC